MKRICAFIFGFLVVSNISFSQHKLVIEIVEIRNNSGNIMIQLFDADKKVLNQDAGQIKDNKCSFAFGDLGPGKYAVRYYHDENLNGKMETNLVGKPTEGYGFSNNVIGRFGPPPYEKWLFEIAGDKKIILKPTY